jgi:hypothetical protein
MKIIKYFILFFPVVCLSQNAGTNSGGVVNQVQPSIITVPLKKQGENYRQMVEDPNKGFYIRTALNVVDQAFKERGFVTNDFVGVLERINTLNTFSSDNKTDEQTLILDNSPADIFVTVDINVETNSSGTEVSLFLVARDASTGAKLYTSLPGNSGKFYTSDISKLIIKALNGIKEDFLTQLQISFSDIVNNGRQIILTFKVNQNSDINFNTEVGSDGDLLSESISDWLGLNVYKNYAKPSGSSSNQLSYEIKLPLKNQSNGTNYRPKEDFGRLLRKYLISLKIDNEVTSPQLGQLLVVIKGANKNK